MFGHAALQMLSRGLTRGQLRPSAPPRLPAFSLSGIIIRRHASSRPLPDPVTMPSAHPKPRKGPPRQPFAARGSVFLSCSRQPYRIEEALQLRRGVLAPDSGGQPHNTTGHSFVYLASCEGKKYILKDCHSTPRPLLWVRDIEGSPRVRLPVDHIEGPDERHDLFPILVYPYLDVTLQDLDMTEISPASKKLLLRFVLEGLVHLHHRRVIHNDIKPDNIMANLAPNPDGTTSVSNIQITDLEDMEWLERDFQFWLRSEEDSGALYLLVPEFY